MTTILALDTATEACSVALLHQGQHTFMDELSPRSHTQRILPMVDELLTQAGIDLRQVDYLAFGRGPGSFTGVRVGVGIAQGLAMGADLPVVALSNLHIMAEQAYQTLGATEVVALIDARMNEVYFTQLTKTADGWQDIIPEQVCSPEKAIAQFRQERNPTVVGTGWAAYPAFAAADLGVIVSDITLPSARYILPLALAQAAQGRRQSALEIEPVYLRNEVTWKKLPHKL
ncbi:tRNA (adenosine(37)-N6)-threonylcarbamoyltransferase complex dimerization subunit type 1 TsaB [Muribacter muris]|uniref:tRNA threonylcarbamoyladenosine biosynthesis protein TsaB n=1 Tax=Muribacter muris TaxID=67855 RepID=A0A4Y9K1B3_9PAST|nr:tRNA (adenosine(37)-N6)-threonylcarbamoyltransferase complex dimerization subunit type 1 TsaB [Muribacter muris]MBF0784876.1 tRNA (adenosine(37)-N6)-threonylcarbamoyltransferase complex dimerization subunit type 1 TsaB [Muribacter muris]MBF0826495.1 tRNA (adenosine(37)-N6)-threonylcarbamoyltransferase complex dimerization subunit type 1 TsaB [Muribacter muris]TFV10949.1 tRNA (adenosine(37)-N6)-threonylcarbamoyltransferase complex dimerization subunit type 1 TsaB [Muribacter muris]